MADLYPLIALACAMVLALRGARDVLGGRSLDGLYEGGSAIGLMLLAVLTSHV